jgi:hypothetical protein
MEHVSPVNGWVQTIPGRGNERPEPQHRNTQSHRRTDDAGGASRAAFRPGKPDTSSSRNGGPEASQELTVGADSLTTLWVCKGKKAVV